MNPNLAARQILIIAFAAAFEALVAIARRCSAVIVFSLALPPRRPNSDRYFDNKDFAISAL